MRSKMTTAASPGRIDVDVRAAQPHQPSTAGRDTRRMGQEVPSPVGGIDFWGRVPVRSLGSWKPLSARVEFELMHFQQTRGTRLRTDRSLSVDPKGQNRGMRIAVLCNIHGNLPALQAVPAEL
jgi:hypothetical protein